MAVYFLHIKVLSRGKGSRVTRAAAYRAGERMRDERTSDSYNFSNRQDVVHKEILLPSQFAGRADMGWAQDRSTLWNAAEHAGRRRNSRLAREVMVALPPELTSAQRINLVRTFSRELADKYQSAVDFVVHEPRRGSDERNHHAHMLMTTREVTPGGLGPRTTLELGGRERHARGLGPSREEYLSIRERWAQVTNEALLGAGVTARIDHRSYKDQGIDREPTPAMPKKIYYMEQRNGMRTQAGDDIRAKYRERVEARVKGGDELARVLQRQKEQGRQRAIESSKQREGPSKTIPHGALTREELNQKRRERYRVKADVERGRALQRTGANAVHESTQAERNAVLLSQPSPSATAEQSVRNWLAFRASQKPGPTAEESARNWWAYRESQRQADLSGTASRDRSHEQEVGADGKDGQNNTGRGRDYDFGL